MLKSGLGSGLELGLRCHVRNCKIWYRASVYLPLVYCISNILSANANINNLRNGTTNYRSGLDSFCDRRRRRGNTGAGQRPLCRLLKYLLLILYTLNHIYSRNITATSGSFNLCAKIIYDILMLPVLIESFFKYICIISRYNPIW